MTSAAVTMLVREAPIVAPSPGVQVATSISRVLANVRAAVGARKPEHGGFMPRLVAVTKKQPVEKVVWAYRQGIRHFGENYVQELHSKATHIEELGDCPDIKWHFIGHLQRNKTKILTSVPGLWMVETLDSVKAARTLNRHWSYREVEQQLRVLVQVNIGSDNSDNTKHGVGSDDCLEVVQYIRESCDHLLFAGLMTIGRMNYDPELAGPNPDFLSLVECGSRVKSQIPFSGQLELSMGMSADYEHAVELGSTNIRVGTALFGERPS